jgi:hypothetical protein
VDAQFKLKYDNHDTMSADFVGDILPASANAIRNMAEPY